MTFYSLASGSKGNATLIVANGFPLLIDFGMTKTRMKELLAQIHYTIDDIEAFLFTHEHQDHAAGIAFTNEAKRWGYPGVFKVNLGHYVKDYEPVQIGPLMVTPFPVSHDAKHPLGFKIEHHDQSLVLITDTGYISERNLQLCSNAHDYILESNHNVKMLLKTQRSQETKVRILADEGHLSNEDSAFYFAKMMGPQTRAVYLGHISDQANTPQLAVETYQKVLQKLGKLKPDLKIIPTQQHAIVVGGDL
jgi:phosphoribosyl 1,2-cyclic phosphodiesterase